ncbi:MAG: glycosyltransferase family 4 protein [Gloeotrichia echinulata HAB0833]
MKILFVTPRFPYPLLRGDQFIPYHRLRILSQRHEITLLTLYHSAWELENIDRIHPYCKAIYPVHLPKWQSLINVGKGLFSSQLPLQACYYSSNKFQQQLDSILAANNFDILHAFMMRIAPYFHHIHTPKIIELIDSMQLNLERRVALESFPKRLIFQEELRRVIRYERDLSNLFDNLVVVSEKDAQLIPSQRVKVIPFGIDTEFFSLQQEQPLEPTLIFSGNMSYAPNIHAVRWFVELCLPIIQQTIPDVSLVIAGANPVREVRSLEQKVGVTVTGFVESMPETLKKAKVAIAPMQSGSGMQSKILEAMASGLPVVTTTLGLGSLSAKPDKEILIADNPEDFAQATITLLQNPMLAGEIRHQARQFVVNKYSWEFSASQVEKIYNQILSI